MGIITFFAMLLSAAILLLIFGIAFLKYSHKNSIYKRIKFCYYIDYMIYLIFMSRRFV